jgi:mevalonate kinase
MMHEKLHIPAKTFILGEYAALQGYPAIILTTSPGFQLMVQKEKCLQGIHSNAPAGKLWRDHLSDHLGLSFIDPHQGLGGLGASTAQFVGVYLMWTKQKPSEVNVQHFYETYLRYAWNTEGISPSGYDALAQLMGTQYGEKPNRYQLDLIQNDNYPQIKDSLSSSNHFTFSQASMALILVHTGIKCPTHEYLSKLQLSDTLELLSREVIHAWKALKSLETSHDARGLMNAIQSYYKALNVQGWVAPHTQELVKQIKHWEGVGAVKGCGALGSDVLLLLVQSEQVDKIMKNIHEHQLKLLFYGA